MSDSKQSKVAKINIVVCGKQMSGKTTLIDKLLKRRPRDAKCITAKDVGILEIQSPNNKDFKQYRTLFWEMLGEPTMYETESFREHHYGSAEFFIYCIDVNDQSWQRETTTWYDDVINRNTNAPIIFVATNCSTDIKQKSKNEISNLSKIQAYIEKIAKESERTVILLQANAKENWLADAQGQTIEGGISRTNVYEMGKQLTTPRQPSNNDIPNENTTTNSTKRSITTSSYSKIAIAALIIGFLLLTLGIIFSPFGVYNAQIAAVILTPIATVFLASSIFALTYKKLLSEFLNTHSTATDIAIPACAIVMAVALISIGVIILGPLLNIFSTPSASFGVNAFGSSFATAWVGANLLISGLAILVGNIWGIKQYYAQSSKTLSPLDFKDENLPISSLNATSKIQPQVTVAPRVVKTSPSDATTEQIAAPKPERSWCCIM